MAEKIFLNVFLNNRKKLYNKIREGSAAVFFAGHAPAKRGDENYPFSPDRNFYYLTGIAEENFILFMGKSNEAFQTILYIKRDNGDMAKWVGANLTAQEALELSGISGIKYLDEFQEDIAAYSFKNQLNSLYLDLENRSFSKEYSEAQYFCEKFKKRFPSVDILDSYPIMSGLRLIKEDYEINLMRKAIAITVEAFRAMFLNARAGMMEYEIEAYFDYVLKKNGVMDRAFTTIAAAGKNGTILHYSKNTAKANDGDLILIDAGAQVGYYNGDISRTFPVNGKFSEKQIQIYEIVLEGQRLVIEAIAPGVEFSSLNKILKDYYLKALKEIGMVKNMADVEKCYFHGVSHFLGAETHDVGRYMETELLPGMVLTVEPGLYFEELCIGIRIEDDVLVTQNGCEVLSQGLPKTVAEIESFMAGSRI